jgi:hypothetical protein
MNFVVALYAAILFFLLSPNVLLRLPKKGSVKVVAAVHAVVFGLLLFFTSRFVSQLSMLMSNMMPSKKEGLAGESCTKRDDCNGTNEACMEGTCQPI